DGCCHRVVRAFEDERADDWYAGGGRFLSERVDVGEQAIAQPGEFSDDLDGLVAVVPGLAPAHAVEAGVRGKQAELGPADVEGGVRRLEEPGVPEAADVMAPHADAANAEAEASTQGGGPAAPGAGSIARAVDRVALRA